MLAEIVVTGRVLLLVPLFVRLDIFLGAGSRCEPMMVVVAFLDVKSFILMTLVAFILGSFHVVDSGRRRFVLLVPFFIICFPCLGSESGSLMQMLVNATLLTA